MSFSDIKDLKDCISPMGEIKKKKKISWNLENRESNTKESKKIFLDDNKGKAQDDSHMTGIKKFSQIRAREKMTTATTDEEKVKKK